VKKYVSGIVFIFLASCSGGGSDDSESNDQPAVFCFSQEVQGGLSQVSYTLPFLEADASTVLSSSKVVTNGNIFFNLSASCSSLGEWVISEEMDRAECDPENDFNAREQICEEKFFYTPAMLNSASKIKVFDLRSPVQVTSGNTFRVVKNDLEIFSSNLSQEILDGKIQVNGDLQGRLEILTESYDSSLNDGDEVCYEFTSEARPHCFYHSEPLGALREKVLTVFNESPQSSSLLNLTELTEMESFGGASIKSISSIDERGNAQSENYLELNRSGVYFNQDFTLNSGRLYRLNIEVNSDLGANDATLIIYDQDDFEAENYQQNYIRKIHLNTIDSSRRRKITTHDFLVSDLQKAEGITVLLQTDKKILVKNFTIEEVDLNSTVKDHSLFLTFEPNRDGFSSNSVPDKYVPHGMTGGYGYGNFAIDSLLEKYEIYVNYELEFQTTQAHIYEKSSLTGDSLMGWNKRGVNDSAPGGNSQDYLHGTLFQGLGWTPVKNTPDNYVVILHTEGGHFALDGSNILVNYSPFNDETSVGGVSESGTRFNNRVSRKLSERPLRAQNTNDPLAPTVGSVDHYDYYTDMFMLEYVEDDGFGGAQLTPFADSMGYSLTDDYLFYLYDDQGLTYDSGGPEGALAGVLHPQISYFDYLIANNLSGEDTDLDGFSDRVEYISHTDPNDAMSAPLLDAFDIFEDDGSVYKYVSLRISKEAQNFNIIVYEVLSNGVEKPIWSFDRGRGIESDLIYYIYEFEDYISLDLLSREQSGTAVDLKVKFQ
jgi:hypothetical protein